MSVELTSLFAVVSLLYFFAVNSMFLFLIGASVWALRRQSQLEPLTRTLGRANSAFAPSISILAPAYNEGKTVVESVNSFLLLNYPSFEVIVINDGSKDDTLDVLKKAFALERVSPIYDRSLSATKVRGCYRSRLHPNLTVVDKVNGGKADALNVGIGFARYDHFCAVDSDSLLENDALLRVAAPFLDVPNKIVATGGTVRIANGARVRFGRVESVRLPRNFLVLMQVVEYTRAFLCGRIGWNVFNSTLVISGAFGLFSKQTVKEIGGYLTGSVGEDMELILRLHRHCRDQKRDYSIVFVPDPVCWTEAPETWSALGKQRDRWQRGLADCLMQNRRMMFRRRYGFIGWLALPYFLFVELLGPLFEVLSLIAIGISMFYPGFDNLMFLAFFSASLLYSSLLSMASLIVEEVFYSKYTRPTQFLTLFLVCLAEGFYYRQVSTFWRLKGLYKYLRGDHSWGHLQRVGFSPAKRSGKAA